MRPLAVVPPDVPDEADRTRWIGREVRSLRKARGLTLSEVAEASGLSIGYLSLVERDKATPSINALHAISRSLGVTVSWFFEGLEADGPSAELTPRQRMCLELARNFAAIDNEKHQEALSQMARALAVQAQGGAL